MEQKAPKIGTVTWISYYNLGTYLQAYALQRVVISLGYTNEIISDSKYVHSQTQSLLRKFRRSLQELVSSDRAKFSKSIQKSHYQFEDFMANHLIVNKKWQTFDELNKTYDIFLCGSDQIWSPILPLNPFYYLGFCHRRKIAYAPSIGVGYFPETRKKQVKGYIDSFNFLSVREAVGKKLLESFIDKPISVVLDPTLLLDQSEWQKLRTKNVITKKNILCYFLTFNKKYIEKIKEFSKKQNLLLSIVITDYRFLRYADIPLFIGPSEFLAEIEDATYVITDSFHGTVFSVIFKKKFLTVERFPENTSNNQNSRIHNILHQLGLVNHLIKYGMLNLEEKFPHPFNFEETSKKLSLLKRESLDYLQKALNHEAKYL